VAKHFTRHFNDLEIVHLENMQLSARQNGKINSARKKADDAEGEISISHPASSSYDTIFTGQLCLMPLAAHPAEKGAC